MKRGKKYQEAAKKIDRKSLYSKEDAIRLVKEASGAKFDETVEVHIRTGCDGRHAEQLLHGRFPADESNLLRHDDTSAALRIPVERLFAVELRLWIQQRISFSL